MKSVVTCEHLTQGMSTYHEGRDGVRRCLDCVHALYLETDDARLYGIYMQVEGLRKFRAEERPAPVYREWQGRCKVERCRERVDQSGYCDTHYRLAMRLGLGVT